MKTRFLIIILCLACSVSFAQRKKSTKKPVRKATTQAPVTLRVNPDKQQVAGANGAQNAGLQLVDTTKRKPFDRPLDGYYKKNNILSAKVTPYANLREADVMFAKRVWREIDLREKMNQYLASPKGRLIDVLMAAIDAGELTAYDPTSTKDDPNGDSFSRPLSAAQARSKMADSSVVDQFDKNTGDKIGSKVVAGEFNPDSVVKFRIKEDWVFDKQRSVFEPRIIGIAPLYKPKAAGLDLDYQPAFWIYFPEARQVLAVKEAVSRNNDATGLSFDDVFVKRIFSSYIVKQSNDKDERIRDYAQGIDKLYESERIKKNLMDWELNLWSY
ncbi:gliding motility protein GldN [Mucilaginibacter terrigena]|uniref:Gliding motility protein GldN n=1 Tax=Mucilaginibacter terrigena TaxID=2492395 RepID=A0A4Q5LNG9_9SPHI|nr:gliding motility protein GldN [Mucilaginibacter terrigena]RYU90349.1 gliding motility protein GldN [Mucilaginibacter terrigena]